VGSSDLLTVDINARGSAVVVSVRGELDLATVPVLRERLDSISEVSDSPSPLVIDLSAVTFIGSAGLALLVEQHNKCEERGTPMALVVAGSVVPRAIQVTALDQVFAVHTTVDDAIAGA
jgi:anti-anti-sigma factor